MPADPAPKPPKLPLTREALASGVLPDIAPGTRLRRKSGALYRFRRWGINATRQVYVAHYESADGEWGDEEFTRDAEDFLNGQFEIQPD